MSKSVESTRRELFEHAVKRDWLESMICFQRKADGYADSDTDNAWWAFNAALDAVEIELPMVPDPRCGGGDHHYGLTQGINSCRKSVESLNLGLKIK